MVMFTFCAVSPGKMHAWYCTRQGRNGADIFLPGSTRVSMNLNRGNFFQKRNSKIKIWEENRKRAEQVGTRLKQHIQDLEVLIKDMKESLSKVTSPEVLYETAKSVKDLCASSYDVFSEFNGWRNFQLADAELTFLKTAHLETATTATSAPRGLVPNFQPVLSGSCGMWSLRQIHCFFRFFRGERDRHTHTQDNLLQAPRYKTKVIAARSTPQRRCT